ncbi:hypothetical protein MCON_1687 [Methanothrix soehngenii GP6]|uniref:Uncharacterized protein n=3 Tax=root TaxID=1 RepID=F4BUR8_METSG|nr:hypothetical protein MCON_1687 [Methanothrix soehngenii GP6]
MRDKHNSEHKRLETMSEKKHACDSCPLRRYSDKHPDSVVARIWRWHTGWCPGWKAYQVSLAETASR